MDQTTKKQWKDGLQADFPWLPPGYAEMLVDQYDKDPAWFHKDNLDKLFAQFKGRAQELRGKPDNGWCRTATPEELAEFNKAAAERAGKLDCLPLNDNKCITITEQDGESD